MGSSADGSDYDSSHHCFPARGWCILRMLHSMSKPVTGRYEIGDGNAQMSWIAPAWLPQKSVAVRAHRTYFEMLYWGIQIRSLVAPIWPRVQWKGSEPKPPEAAVVFPSTLQGDCTLQSVGDPVCWRWPLVPAGIMHIPGYAAYPSST